MTEMTEMTEAEKWWKAFDEASDAFCRGIVIGAVVMAIYLWIVHH